MTPTMMSGPFVLGCCVCWSSKTNSIPLLLSRNNFQIQQPKHGGRTIYLFLLLYKQKLGCIKRIAATTTTTTTTYNQREREREISIIYIYIYIYAGS
jgi:hypothetical protein